MNSSYTLDASRGKAASVAGFAFLFAIALVVIANYGINFRLIIPGNSADTARNILAHETLFRLNIACNLNATWFDLPPLFSKRHWAFGCCSKA